LWYGEDAQVIYGIELDRSEVGHVEPVLVALERMGKKVTRIFGEEQVSGGRSVNNFLTIKREDTVVCVGDRLELMRFLINHCPTSRICQLHAGEETSASMDDSRWRWVITELAAENLAPTVEAMENLEERGYHGALVGAPCLQGCAIRRREAAENPPLNGRDYVLFAMNGYRAIQDGEWEAALRATAEAARVRGWWTYVVTPNREACPKYELTEEQNKLVQSVYGLGHWEYQRIIAGAIIMVGNSSAGMIEAPTLGTPTINVGSRQEGRPVSSSVFDLGVNELEKMDKWFEYTKRVTWDDLPYECCENPAELAAEVIAEGCK
jgi:UDP-N-acetylglucosamine 2-epimerase